MTAWIRSSPLTAFLVFAFAGSWIVWSPLWLPAFDINVFPVEALYGTMSTIRILGMITGPLAAAVAVTAVRFGRAGVLRLAASLVKFNAAPQWYLLVLIGIPIAAGLGFLLTSDLRPETDVGLWLVSYYLASLVTYAFGGPLMQEPGWRGVLLPLLQERFHPLIAAVLIGVTIVVWQLPLAAIAEPGGWSLPDIAATLAGTIALSIIMTWLFNGSRGSVLLAILASNAYTWTIVTAGFYLDNVSSLWPVLVGLGTLALLAIALSRGRLGHDPADPIDPAAPGRAHLQDAPAERPEAQRPEDPAEPDDRDASS